jgi:di/tricarboxylate transporter
MDPIVTPMIVAGVIEVIAIPLTIFILEKIIGRRLDKFDSKREIARAEQAKTERKIIEQREAERDIVLAIARTMLLDN